MTYKPGHEPKKHGGKRQNAGRKRTNPAPKADIETAIEMAVRAIPEAGSIDEVIALARTYSTTAVKVLGIVAVQGQRESARVAAAAKIIEIARIGERDAAVDLGKKEQRAADAKSASVGRFATPAPPPRLVVDNR